MSITMPTLQRLSKAFQELPEGSPSSPKALQGLSQGSSRLSKGSPMAFLGLSNGLSKDSLRALQGICIDGGSAKRFIRMYNMTLPRHGVLERTPCSERPFCPSTSLSWSQPTSHIERHD